MSCVMVSFGTQYSDMNYGELKKTYQDLGWNQNPHETSQENMIITSKLFELTIQKQINEILWFH